MLKTDRVKLEPAIMQPMDVPTFKEEACKPDVVSDADFKSIPFLPCTNDEYEVQDHSTDRSFLLMDGNENLHIITSDMFCKKLNCTENDKIKVVSIFGNTGDGKSHTMNHAFFNGEMVFKTSAEQNSCTLGVYAAMQQKMGVLCLDTEGLLGTTVKSSRRMRMLLKILAISDLVIYRTRSERLHSDMYDFLATASKAFCTHFDQALQSLAIPGTAKMKGPAVIVFHETRHTKPLESSVDKSAEDKLRESFAYLKLEMNAFSSLRYVGVQTENNHNTDYSKLIAAIRAEIENTTVRSARQPNVVFKAVKALNQKFSGEILEQHVNPFPEQYFTCPVHCECCERRCQRSMGHMEDGESHYNKSPCNYQYKYTNKVFLCKICYQHGKQVIVSMNLQSQNDSFWSGMAKFAWKGSVIECPNCGEIYRSRQNWYGNKTAENSPAVRSEIVHVWKGGDIQTKAPAHSAQMVFDGVAYIGETITSISAQPTRAISDWFADKVAPSYWRPNHEIIKCNVCKTNFETTGLRKHHCRGCGEGVCHACSKHEMPVPARGWDTPARVCNICREGLLKNPNATPGNATKTDEGDILARKYGETIYNTISTVATVALELPKEMIKDTARPSYWVPDAESPNCFICKIPFGTAEELLEAKEKGLLNGTATGSNNNSSRLPSGSNHSGAVGSGSGGGGGSMTKSITGECKRHHCRRCGQAVCEHCSRRRQPVPERGWSYDVRVCDICVTDETKPNAVKAVGDVKSKED